MYIEEEKKKTLSRLYILRSGKTGRAMQCLIYALPSPTWSLTVSFTMIHIASSIFKAFCFFESRVTQILTISSYFPAPPTCHYYNCYINICQPRDTILRIVHFCLGTNLKLKFMITKIHIHKNTNTTTQKHKYKICVATASKAVSGGAVVIRSHEQGFTKRAKKRGTEWITCFETTI